MAPASAAAASQPQPSTQPHALTGRQQPRSAASISPACCQASGEVLLPARGSGQPSGGSARASQASEVDPAPARGSGHRTRSIAGAGQAPQGDTAPARGGGQQSAAGTGAQSRGGPSKVSITSVVMSCRFTNRGTSLQESGLQASKQGTQATTLLRGQHSSVVVVGFTLAGSLLSALLQVSVFSEAGSMPACILPHPPQSLLQGPEASTAQLARIFMTVSTRPDHATPFSCPWCLLQAPEPSTAQPQQQTPGSPAGASARMASSVLGKRLSASQSDQQPEEVEAASEEQGEAATTCRACRVSQGLSISIASPSHEILSDCHRSQPARQAKLMLPHLELRMHAQSNMACGSV